MDKLAKERGSFPVRELLLRGLNQLFKIIQSQVGLKLDNINKIYSPKKVPITDMDTIKSNSILLIHLNLIHIKDKEEIRNPFNFYIL